RLSFLPGTDCTRVRGRWSLFTVLSTCKPNVYISTVVRTRRPSDPFDNNLPATRIPPRKWNQGKRELARCPEATSVRPQKADLLQTEAEVVPPIAARPQPVRAARIIRALLP